MAPKRKIANITTGGTGDVRPQVLSINALQATIGQEQVTVFPTPVPRTGFEQDLAQVMEVLSVQVYVHHATVSPVGLSYAILSTRSIGSVTGAPISQVSIRQQVASASAFASYIEVVDVPVGQSIDVSYPKLIDFRDGAGHGVLIATDSVILTHGAVAAGGPIDVTMKILYRMINIGVMEYVGIVQSQG